VSRARSGPRKRAPARRRRPLLRWALLLVLAGAVGYGAALLIPGPLRPSADAAVAGVPAVQVRIGAYRDHGGGVEIAPADGGADVLLILYPGGLVRPHAYAWIGVALAPVGIRTLVPTMPLDLAVLGRDRAGRLIDGKRAGERLVVVGGHSLGGAMAAGWAARTPERADGLILMGAYPAAGDDLSDAALPTLVLAAEHDGLATLDEVREGLTRLPPSAGLEIVGGAVHAFFGRYGPQRGDGLPRVPRATAEAEIAGAIEAFLAGLR
jgi:pimeloyl-ACP methyl ester carboxylesterase